MEKTNETDTASEKKNKKKNKNKVLAALAGKVQLILLHSTLFKETEVDWRREEDDDRERRTTAKHTQADRAKEMYKPDACLPYTYTAPPHPAVRLLGIFRRSAFDVDSSLSLSDLLQLLFRSMLTLFRAGGGRGQHIFGCLNNSRLAHLSQSLSSVLANTHTSFFLFLYFRHSLAQTVLDSR